MSSFFMSWMFFFLFSDFYGECYRSITMGQRMSSKDDLSHSMKKLRLTSSDPTAAKRSSLVVFTILDAPSPSSPVRKESSGEYDLMRRAINAPFDTDFVTTSFDENGNKRAINDIESNDVSTKLVCDGPIVNGKQNMFFFEFS